MKSKPFPLKYRPLKFENLIGQDMASKFLSELIKKGQIARNIVLHGPFGSGKSSACRIYARALNCLNPDISGSPCNTCEFCSTFLNEGFTDFHEFDGASKGKIDEIRDLLVVARTPPNFGKYRIFNIDEAQGLSKQAFDALLKLIEEPPPYLVFIFTTTEIGKVRAPIISRCTPLSVYILSSEDSMKYLKYICKEEGIEYDGEALNIISALSKGHPRDLAKNLETVSILGQVNIENTKLTFNIEHFDFLLKIFDLILQKDIINLIYFNRGWKEDFNIKYDKLSEFIIFLYYNFVLNMGVEINPLLNLVDKDKLISLNNKLSDLYKNTSTSNQDFYLSLIDILNKSAITSDMSFELFLIKFFNYLNEKKFVSNNFGSTSPIEFNGSKKGKRRKGRQFNKSPLESSENSLEDKEQLKPEPISDTVEGVGLEEKTIYAHNLPDRGFDVVKEEDVNLKTL